MLTNPVLVTRVSQVYQFWKSFVWDWSCLCWKIQGELSWSSEQGLKCVFIYKPSAVSFISQKKTESPCILVWKYPALTIVMFNFDSPAPFVCCLPPNGLCSCCVGYSEHNWFNQSVFTVFSPVYIVGNLWINMLLMLLNQILTKFKYPLSLFCWQYHSGFYRISQMGIK